LRIETVDEARDVKRAAGDRSIFRELADQVLRDGRRTQRRAGEKQTSPRDREQYPPGSGLFSGKSIFNHPRDPAAGKWT
jgi:hypothetical protein